MDSVGCGVPGNPGPHPPAPAAPLEPGPACAQPRVRRAASPGGLAQVCPAGSRPRPNPEGPAASEDPWPPSSDLGAAAQEERKGPSGAAGGAVAARAGGTAWRRRRPRRADSELGHSCEGLGGCLEPGHGCKGPGAAWRRRRPRQPHSRTRPQPAAGGHRGCGHSATPPQRVGIRTGLVTPGHRPSRSHDGARRPGPATLRCEAQTPGEWNLGAHGPRSLIPRVLV